MFVPRLLWIYGIVISASSKLYPFSIKTVDDTINKKGYPTHFSLPKMPSYYFPSMSVHHQHLLVRIVGQIVLFITKEVATVTNDSDMRYLSFLMQVFFPGSWVEWKTFPYSPLSIKMLVKNGERLKTGDIFEYMQAGRVCVYSHSMPENNFHSYLLYDPTLLETVKDMDSFLLAMVHIYVWDKTVKLDTELIASLFDGLYLQASNGITSVKRNVGVTRDPKNLMLRVLEHPVCFQSDRDDQRAIPMLTNYHYLKNDLSHVEWLRMLRAITINLIQENITINHCDRTVDELESLRVKMQSLYDRFFPLCSLMLKIKDQTPYQEFDQLNNEVAVFIVELISLKVNLVLCFNPKKLAVDIYRHVLIQPLLHTPQILKTRRFTGLSTLMFEQAIGEQLGCKDYRELIKLELTRILFSKDGNALAPFKRVRKSVHFKEKCFLLVTRNTFIQEGSIVMASEDGSLYKCTVPIVVEDLDDDNSLNFYTAIHEDEPEAALQVVKMSQ